MNLLSYRPDQAQEIEALFTKVFSASEGPSEGALVGNLAAELMATTEKQDLYGFVAVEQEEIVGCIFFSRLTFGSGISAFLLSPVAVHTALQGKGIGQQLIDFGITQLKAEGVELLLTYGDPGFYAKVGFSPIAEATIQAPLPLSAPEGWLGQSLIGSALEPIKGRPSCVGALNKPEYW